jgi:outer membrane murein-binding lipoprotein Lpp
MPAPVCVDNEKMNRIGTDVEHTEAHRSRLQRDRDVLVT